jgi:thioredoxin
MNLTDKNFEAEIKKQDKLVLVDFFAVWCEPCSMLAPILEKVAEDLKDKVVLMKANLDDIPQIAGKFGVDRIPMVIVFKNSQPVTGFIGLRDERAIKEMIENVFSQPTPKPLPKGGGRVENGQEISERYYNYAIANGFRLNPDKKITDRVINGFLENEKKYGKKYCPCRRVTGDIEKDSKIICPCAFHKDEIAKDGHCLCNLFVK